MLSPITQVSHLYNKVGNTKVLYIFNLVGFWTWEGLKILVIIPIIWRNFVT